MEVSGNKVCNQQGQLSVCGTTLQQWVAAGHDNGTTISKWPSDADLVAEGMALVAL
jgi:hypothetical protein